MQSYIRPNSLFFIGKNSTGVGHRQNEEPHDVEEDPFLFLLKIPQHHLKPEVLEVFCPTIQTLLDKNV